jgi:hypothetical protein
MRYIFALATALVVLAALSLPANARCGRGSYKVFLHGFESARDSMRTKPQAAYNAFVGLRSKAEACGRGEDRAEVRYKLQLFETGLTAYIGAADAERGNVARGRAEADAAMAQALAIERAHRSKPADLQLAQELVAQMKTPLQIIEGLQGSPSPQPKPSA